MADGRAELATFAAWIDALDRIARERGLAEGRLSERTGEEAWFEAYRDGLTPVEALDEDAGYNA